MISEQKDRAVQDDIVFAQNAGFAVIVVVAVVTRGVVEHVVSVLRVRRRENIVVPGL